MNYVRLAVVPLHDLLPTMIADIPRTKQPGFLCGRADLSMKSATGHLDWSTATSKNRLKTYLFLFSYNT